MHDEPKLNVSFRFLALSVDDANQLGKLPIDASFGQHHKTGDTTAIIPLNNNAVKHILEFVKDRDIDTEETDIFMSLVTDYDTRILDVPREVNEVINALDCRLVYSFTYVGEL